MAAKRLKVLHLGPAMRAVSGVTTHLNQLFGSVLVQDFTLLHFQVGSEGRRETLPRKLLRFLMNPFEFAAFLLRHKPDIVHLNSSCELGCAKTIAEQFKTDHHELTISQEHLMQHLPALVRYRDAPVAEPSDISIYLLSLEARMPFMDHELAALVSGLPDEYRVKGCTTKWILREAMKRLLPPEILERPKVGFRVPVNEWFRGPMREYLVDHLTGNDSRTRQYYNRPALDRVLGEHVSGRQNMRSCCGVCSTWKYGTGSSMSSERVPRWALEGLTLIKRPLS